MIVKLVLPEPVAPGAGGKCSGGPANSALANFVVGGRVSAGSVDVAQLGHDLLAVGVYADDVGTIRQVCRDGETLGQGEEGKKDSELHCALGSK